MGLSIVKRLLNLHHSQIHLTSKVGRGTKVEFTIFYKEDNEDKIAIPVITESTSENNLKGKKVLVVDDNKINVLVTKKTLEKYGVIVYIAYNGLDGIAIAKEQSLDLILMDINMPGLNGFETTEAIREFNLQIPIIALTAVEEEKIVTSGKKDVFTSFIIKPYKETTFISLLNSYVSYITV